MLPTTRVLILEEEKNPSLRGGLVKIHATIQ